MSPEWFNVILVRSVMVKFQNYDSEHGNRNPTGVREMGIGQAQRVSLALAQVSRGPAAVR